MAAFKMLNLMAIATLAMFASTLSTPVDALSAGHQHLNRQVPHLHEAIAKKKRGSNGRCKPRSSTSSLVVVSTSVAVPVITTSAAPAKTTSVKPTTTKSSTPASTPTKTSSGSSGSAKIGISWNSENNAASLVNVLSDNVAYLYSWSPWKPQDNIFGLKFAPMLWGPKQQSDWNKLVVPGYANLAIALNEPDEPTQLNMDPGDAAAYWKSQVQSKAGEGYELWGPAVTSSTRGETWMDNFLAACNGGCTFTHNALHFYDTDPQALITYVQHWHNKYGKPIVLTEFACQNFGGGAQADSGQVWAFYKTVIPWLMSQDYVTAFFPFGFLEDMGNVNPLNQMLKGGQLTDLGNYIVHGPY
ncbi:glycoside hydrolase family 128 protein [Phlebiopsis gigantea 11061_1 CR5-6]|uniref:Glycoside hydrolase family 128 protein n=1 Tax=Phlebiopsis gigantea (strain 11061_1 CR5-6) TaxID=745531 RepID=A0A0C3SFX2_PHLG1|nr:glycoside hydrolase family 128 protein [Phlebiopsis gigantea 11061_1 CR5-6]